MGTDVVIHRCTLRLVRRGGWSWGADPRALLRAVTLRLPHLIGARLAQLWPEELDAELSAPVRLRMPLKIDELVTLAGELEQRDPGATALPEAVARQVDELVRDLLRRSGGAGVERPRQPAQAHIEGPKVTPPVLHTWRPAGVLAVLLDWRRQGILHSQLLQFSPTALACWHANLLRTEGDLGPAGAPCDYAQLAPVAACCAAVPLPLPAGAAASLIRRISLMVEAAGGLGLAPGDSLLAQALAGNRAFELVPDGDPDTPCPPSGSGLAGAAAAGEGALAAQRQPDAACAAVRAAAGPAPSAQFELNVASALPFLLLGPLSRTGYLQTLGAVFEAGGLQLALPCYAMALARKVLEPPRRGWLRSPQAVIAATAFAGLPAPPEDANIADLARRLGPLVSPLDALVASVLAAGHTAGATLLLQAAPLDEESGWLLSDVEGLFPIAWAGRVERLYPRLAALGGGLLLVPAAGLEHDLLDRIDDAGFRFVTDAHPARGRTWRTLYKDSLRAWTNDRATEPPLLAAAAEQLAGLAPEGAALWRALAVERPALAAGSEPAVERSLSLAAALALGTLAWELWRNREPVSPLLALQRFADLGARVHFRSDRVQVHLPLGRRFLDLKAAGWLHDVPGVPWFGGRPLLFAQG